MEKKDIAIVILAIVSIICLMGLWTYTNKYSYTDEDMVTQIEKTQDEAENACAQNLLTVKESFDGQIAELNLELSERPTKTDLENIQLIVDDLKAQLDAKEEEINNMVVIDMTTEVEEEEDVYEIDDMELGYIVSNKVVSDRDVETLFDGEVEFKDDDYDAEEVIVLNDVTVSYLDADFDGDTYMTVGVEGIKYTYTVEPSLYTYYISYNYPLNIQLLGNDVEISSWYSDTVTVLKGEEELLDINAPIEVEGHTVELVQLSRTTAEISVDGEIENFRRFETKTVNGVKLAVKEIFYYNVPAESGKVRIRIGEIVEETIEDGDEFEEDSIWEWRIDEHSISLINIEQFMYIDDNEDFKALAVGEQLCLPNDYICVRYDGLEDEDVLEYRLRRTTKNGEEVLRMDGEFLVGIEDYDELYVHDDGTVYDDDDFIINDTIFIGDSDVEFQIVDDYVIFRDVEIQMNFTAMNTEIGDICSREENFMSNYGVTVINPEDACDDRRVDLKFPESKLEATIAIVS